MVYKIAYKFILENNIDIFNLDLKVLELILKNKNIKLLEIEKSKTIFKNLDLNLSTNALNCKINDKYYIFYSNSLEYREKIFLILHELGHILLNHSGSKFNFEQELEANLFACEVLFPSVLINYAKYNTIEEIVNNSLLDYKQANFYIKNISECNMNDLINVEILYKFRDRFLKGKKQPKSKKSKYLFIYLAPTLCIIIVLMLAINFNNHYNKSLDTSTTFEAVQDVDTVYITRTGTKYHKEGCVHIKNRETLEISLEDEFLENYDPCTICFPK